MFKLKQDVKLLLNKDHRLYMTTLDSCLWFACRTLLAQQEGVEAQVVDGQVEPALPGHSPLPIAAWIIIHQLLFIWHPKQPPHLQLCLPKLPTILLLILPLLRPVLLCNDALQEETSVTKRITHKTRELVDHTRSDIQRSFLWRRWWRLHHCQRWRWSATGWTPAIPSDLWSPSWMSLQDRAEGQQSNIQPIPVLLVQLSHHRQCSSRSESPPSAEGSYKEQLEHSNPEPHPESQPGGLQTDRRTDRQIKQETWRQRQARRPEDKQAGELGGLQTLVVRVEGFSIQLNHHQSETLHQLVTLWWIWTEDVYKVKNTAGGQWRVTTWHMASDQLLAHLWSEDLNRSIQ